MKIYIATIAGGPSRLYENCIFAINTPINRETTGYLLALG